MQRRGSRGTVVGANVEPWEYRLGQMGHGPAKKIDWVGHSLFVTCGIISLANFCNISDWFTIDYTFLQIVLWPCK